jgi:hypothetical protein
MFHVEEETSERVDVAEGTLDSAELDALEADLANNELTELTQEKIPSSLVANELEVFQLGILRHSFTQNLRFQDRESRLPFDRFITPLVRWLRELQKHPHTAIDEYSGRNNCLPPHKIGFSPRRATIAGDSAVIAIDSASSTLGSSPNVAQLAPFLVQWQVNSTIGMAVANECIVVYPNGQFRMEKSEQRYGGKLKVRAFENSLERPELQQLQGLLDSAKLKNSNHREVANKKSFRKRDVTTLAIPRDGKMQRLSFANYNLTNRVMPETDPDEELILPLRKWLKGHVEARKLDAIPDATPATCRTLSPAQ